MASNTLIGLGQILPQIENARYQNRLRDIKLQQEQNALALQELNLRNSQRAEQNAIDTEEYNKKIRQLDMMTIDSKLRSFDTTERLSNLKLDNAVRTEMFKSQNLEAINKDDLAKMMTDSEFANEKLIASKTENKQGVYAAQSIKYIDQYGIVDTNKLQTDLDALQANLDEKEQLYRKDPSIQNNIDYIDALADVSAFGMVSSALLKNSAVNYSKFMKDNGVNIFVNSAETANKIQNQFEKMIDSYVNPGGDAPKRTKAEAFRMLGYVLNNPESNERKQIESMYPGITDYINSNYDGDFSKYIDGIVIGSIPPYTFGSPDDEEFIYLKTTSEDLKKKSIAMDNYISQSYKYYYNETGGNVSKSIKILGDRLDNPNSLESQKIREKMPEIYDYITRSRGGFKSYLNNVYKAAEKAGELVRGYDDTFVYDNIINNLSSFQSSISQSLDLEDFDNYYNQLSEEERIAIGQKVEPVRGLFTDVVPAAIGWRRLGNVPDKIGRYVNKLLTGEDELDSNVKRMRESEIQNFIRIKSDELIQQGITDPQVISQQVSDAVIQNYAEILPGTKYDVRSIDEEMYPKANPSWGKKERFDYIFKKSQKVPLSTSEIEEFKRLAPLYSNPTSPEKLRANISKTNEDVYNILKNANDVDITKANDLYEAVSIMNYIDTTYSGNSNNTPAPVRRNLFDK